MKETKTGAWIAGAVVLSLVLGAAGWFLMIAPAFAAASETRVQAESQVAQNDVTRARLTRLKAQFEQLDELTAELDELRAEVPTTAELAEFRRLVSSIAAEHGVTVVAVQTSTPTALAPPAPPAPAPVEGEESADAAASPDEGAAPVEQPAAATDGLFAIPLSLDVLGTYPAVLAFLDDLQEKQPRLVAVETLTATGQLAAEAGGGKPATAPGDLGLVVTGYLFAQPDVVDPAVPVPGADGEGSEGEAAPLPAPAPEANPMVPLG